MKNEHTLIDEEGNSWNIELKIENNKLYAIWDKQKSEIDLNSCDILINE